MMEKASAVLDLRGELCPYPALYTGERLKRMVSGEILEVVADGLCAMEGLPDAISQAGHKLLEVESLENGIYRYTIEVA